MGGCSEDPGRVSPREENRKEGWSRGGPRPPSGGVVSAGLGFLQRIDSELVESTEFHSSNPREQAEDAQGTPSQSHISPSILVHEDAKIAGLPTCERQERG